MTLRTLRHLGASPLQLFRVWRYRHPLVPTILDQLDRLPTILWALVVMAAAWVIILAAVAPVALIEILILS